MKIENQDLFNTFAAVISSRIVEQTIFMLLSS